MRQSQRLLAAARGEHIYHTGKPCLHGHDAGRYTRTARCVRCTIEATQRQRREICAKLDAAKGGAA